MRWTEEQYQEFIKKRKSSPSNLDKHIYIPDDKLPEPKYKNKIVKEDGIKFRSRKEADKYLELKLRNRADDIKGFCIQPKFILMEGNEADRAITYAADFIIFHNDNTYEIVDTKGFESAQWERTHKMFRLKYPDLELKVEK